MLVPWSESDNLGIPAVDEQHRRLYAMLNELNHAMGEGRGKEVANEILKRLGPFIRIHFETEEKILQERCSPVYHRCCAQHAEQLSMLQSFLKDKNAHDPLAVIDLLYFLDSLLEGHIDSNRRELGFSRNAPVQ